MPHTVTYVRVKHKGDPDSQAFFMQVSGNHDEKSAVQHAIGIGAGFESLGVLTAEEYAELIRPRGHPQQPTLPTGHNPPLSSDATLAGPAS